MRAIARDIIFDLFLRSMLIFKNKMYLFLRNALIFQLCAYFMVKFVLVLEFHCSKCGFQKKKFSL